MLVIEFTYLLLWFFVITLQIAITVNIDGIFVAGLGADPAGTFVSCRRAGELISVGGLVLTTGSGVVWGFGATGGGGGLGIGGGGATVPRLETGL